MYSKRNNLTCIQPTFVDKKDVQKARTLAPGFKWMSVAELDAIKISNKLQDLLVATADTHVVDLDSCNAASKFLLSYGMKGYIPPHLPSLIARHRDDMWSMHFVGTESCRL